MLFPVPQLPIIDLADGLPRSVEPSRPTVWASSRSASRF